MRRLDETFILSFIAVKGGRLISPKYTNQRDLLMWECKNGHQWIACWDSIKNANSWCPYCSQRAKPDLTVLQEYAKTKNGLLLSSTYVNNKTPLCWKCLECNTEWLAAWGNVKNQNQWCPKCATTKHYITETKVLLILEELLGVAFKKTKVYKNVPKEVRYFEFDGFNKALNLAVEYQGIQHYQYPNWFHKTQTEFDLALNRDRLKREYCKNNNILLLEVPYTHNNNLRSFLIEEINKLNLTKGVSCD